MEKVFDLSSKKGFSKAEEFKQKLENKGLRVSVEPFGLSDVKIIGKREIKPKGKKVWIGDLGESVFAKGKGTIPVYKVKEEDGTISWQLNPDDNSDIVLESATVIPLEQDVRKQIGLKPISVTKQKQKGKKGWKSESVRHSLARKGIKTGRKKR